MVNLTILAGGFATFIATYIFNSDTATLTLTKRSETGPSPSWIASHPTNSSILYAVNEVVPAGQLQSFLVDAEGGLRLVDTVSTGGSGPTFTNPLSTGEVTAMNFGSPNCSLVATDPNEPTRFLRDSPVVEFPVNGGRSNPHMSLEHKGEVFVPDLGADKIWRLVNDGVPGKFRVQGQINIAPGNGPRHIAIQDDILFTLHELTSTLTAQQIPAGPNGTTFPLIANVSIIPPTPPTSSSGAQFNGSFFAAEILISTPTEKFPDPLIYVSNRNLGPDLDPRGDSIAIFQFKKSGPGLVRRSGPGDKGTVPPPPSVHRRRTHSQRSGPGDIIISPPPPPLDQREVVKRSGPGDGITPPPPPPLDQREFVGRSGPGDAGTNPPPPPSKRSGPGDSGTRPPPPPPAEQRRRMLVKRSGPGDSPGHTPPPPSDQRRHLDSRLHHAKRDPLPQLPDVTPVNSVQGTLELQAHVFTGLQQIRSMALGRVSDGGDEFLIAGGNIAGGVVVYRRVDGGRGLEEVARNTDIPSRTSFVFV